MGCTKHASCVLGVGVAVWEIFEEECFGERPGRGRRSLVGRKKKSFSETNAASEESRIPADRSRRARQKRRRVFSCENDLRHEKKKREKIVLRDQCSIAPLRPPKRPFLARHRKILGEQSCRAGNSLPTVEIAPRPRGALCLDSVFRPQARLSMERE